MSQRNQTEINPLIWFPAQMLAAGGNLSITANPNALVPEGKDYNLRSKNGLDGLLKVRDWIDNAYCFYLDILEDPMTAVEDELLAANDYDFLDCPKGMSPFGKEYRKWCIGQVANRKPKASDSKRLRIATFIVSLLDYEDLYERPPDEIYTYGKWYTIYNSLHRHWRITLSKFIDFAVKYNPASDIGECLQSLLSGQAKQDEKLDLMHRYAKAAAARNLKELNGKSAGGRKGAAIAKAERGEDTKRKAILDEAKTLLKDWDRRYPNRHKPPRDEQHSDNAAFRIVANKHKGADGKPIMSAATIGRALRRMKGENRGKHNRTGKKRGRYKART